MKLQNIYIVLVILLVSCVKDRNYDIPNYQQLKEQEQNRANVFNGNKIDFGSLINNASQSIVQYTQNDALEGFVISSDEAGNFYKKIYIQSADKQHVIVLVVDKKGIFGEYPLGSKVQVRLQNTTYWKNYGTTEVGYGKGYSQSGRLRMGYIPQSMVGEVLVKMGEIAPISELTTSFESLKTLADNQNLNKLVTIKEVYFDPNAIGKTFYSKQDKYSTSHLLFDNAKKSIKFVTSSFASYTTDKVPQGTFNITGILTQFGKDFQLQINQIEDIQKIK